MMATRSGVSDAGREDMPRKIGRRRRSVNDAG
jgi:hypothetical protein